MTAKEIILELDVRDYIASSPTSFTISDGSEYYSVTFDGHIGRVNWSPTGDWRVLGLSYHHNSNRCVPWETIRSQLAAGEVLKGYLWDKDHGSTRRWGRKVTMWSNSGVSEAQEGQPDAASIRDYILATGGPPDDPFVILMFKRQAIGYIKWTNAEDPDAGFAGWRNSPTTLAAIKAIRKAKTLDDAIAAFVPWDTEPTFLEMVMRGYF